jgi:hypothetical protein
MRSRRLYYRLRGIFAIAVPLQNFDLTVSILRQLCYKKSREQMYNPLTVPNISGGEKQHLSLQENRESDV